MEFKHTTVLLEEAVDLLNIKEDGTYVDCTLGGGGHTALILSKLSGQGRCISLDQDDQALAYNREQFSEEIASGKLTLVKTNFRDIDRALADIGISKVDGILYDLGVSSPQLDQAERGFSYHQDAELDMRMDQTNPLTAKTVVNEWPYEDLVRIFFRYGEEKFSKQIARIIERKREEQPIETTHELVEIIKEAIPAPARRKGGHPAKRVFQAIRIAVNDELGAVEESLEKAFALLASGGRISVITFHSLEDRIVKTMFKEVSTGPEVPKNLPILPKDMPQADFILVNRKPLTPSEEELEHNPRAASAKLRGLERR